jgi:hypothetical protein
MKKKQSFVTVICFGVILFTACNTAQQPNVTTKKEKPASTEALSLRSCFTNAGYGS